jgi:hypothetical protein
MIKKFQGKAEMGQDYYFEVESFEIYPEVDEYEVVKIGITGETWVGEVNLKWVEITPTGGLPIICAEGEYDPQRPTVLIYGHYYVQPVDSVSEWKSLPFQPALLQYVKDFSGPAAECTNPLNTAGKTKAEALSIINAQIGVAIAMLRKAAADLKRVAPPPQATFSSRYLGSDPSLFPPG